jgi:hypothetical protein
MESKAPGQPVTGDEVRNIRFPETGRHRGAAGPKRRDKRRDYEEAWRDFGQQPGTRLSSVWTGIGRRELRTAEQQTIAAVRDGWLGWPRTLSAGGRTFTLKPVLKSSWLDIAGTISSYQPGKPAHTLADGQAPEKDDCLRQLIDETGRPILYTAGIPRGPGGGYIKFPGHRWLQFPVRGTRRAHAIMTAVDQAGNKVARYRLAYTQPGAWRKVEITVHPGQTLTDELTLAITLSAPWLYQRFDKGQL